MRTNTQNAPTVANNAKESIVRSVLTWGHIITISILAIAAICNIGGLAAVVFAPETAIVVTNYVSAWQGFFIAGVLGYDAKTTVENALKITNSIKELQSTSTTEQKTNG